MKFSSSHIMALFLNVPIMNNNKKRKGNLRLVIKYILISKSTCGSDMGLAGLIH